MKSNDTKDSENTRQGTLILGKYGRMRRTYLKENKNNRMLLNDTHDEHHC